MGTDLQYLYRDAELALGISHVYLHQEQQLIGDNIKRKRVTS